jgi:hypothetical protein
VGVEFYGRRAVLNLTFEFADASAELVVELTLFE